VDNNNSSIVEELEVVGLSQNDVLKDKLSEFFVGHPSQHQIINKIILPCIIIMEGQKVKYLE